MGGVLKAVRVRYVDGGIIERPPRLRENVSWAKPSMVFFDTLLAECVNGDEGTTGGVGRAVELEECRWGNWRGVETENVLCEFDEGVDGDRVPVFSRLGVLGPLKEHLAEYAPAIGMRENRALGRSVRTEGRWQAICLGERRRFRERLIIRRILVRRRGSPMNEVTDVLGVA